MFHPVRRLRIMLGEFTGEHAMSRTAISKNGKPRTAAGKKYDTLKEYEGHLYTGMAIGRHHKWYYDQGEWKEQKITPEKWQFNYSVTKRRAGHAPEGSGVPVGTEYHWFILAHQTAKKENANDYTTSMNGVKFKLAHKRADTGKWSAGEKAQRHRLIKLLEETIDRLRAEDIEKSKAKKNDRAR